MPEEMSFIAPILIGIVVMAIPIVVCVTSYTHRRKMRKIFKTIKIGDRYQFNMPARNPFDKPRHYKATIIGKAMARKYPWVQYRYDDGSVSQDELGEFLVWHEKIAD